VPGLGDQHEGTVGRHGQRRDTDGVGQHTVGERAEVTLCVGEQVLPQVELLAGAAVRDPQRAQVVRALEVGEACDVQPERGHAAAYRGQRVAPHPDHLAVED